MWLDAVEPTEFVEIDDLGERAPDIIRMQKVKSWPVVSIINSGRGKEGIFTITPSLSLSDAGCYNFY